ncbi:ABC transporter ATP-binding protein [Methanogenium sp. MK-MG]|uniref:ABC transporter ATP-binding protein n=1 Tax=Methanogenium sp. MK-MG TaxID=2599926 RepID=UPI0013EBA14F|nr:ABC transporter ATP-binding protein [Methanogenium sp. MK-MG]KAF1078783.1 Vitamin B12 import ATP-binding protein BtuD [Methanogenium sp. MK-MG]
MIDVDDLCAGYGGKDIIGEITFAAGRGEFIGIIGPNGSGKTTLLKAISRVLEISGGVVTLEERALADFGQKELARVVSVVPQDTAMNFSYTVADIVMMGRFPHKERFAKDDPDDYRIVREAMEVTNVVHLKDRPVTDISGGERQRVIIARALAQQPKVILLDEATAHLDISHQVEILSIIRDLGETVTKIGVFHDLNLAAEFCDRIVLMSEGRIRAIGTPAEVLTMDRLRDEYGITAMVQANPVTGRPLVTPLSEGVPPALCGARIHIISGGGTGAGLMYTLSAAGCLLTAGVLSPMDSDYAAASRLGIPCITVPAFAPITPAVCDALGAYLDGADVIILTAMPVGEGNLPNIRVITSTRRSRLVLYVPPGEEFTDCTPAGDRSFLAAIRAAGCPVVSSRSALYKEVEKMVHTRKKA